jgi:hypothetical protein
MTSQTTQPLQQLTDVWLQALERTLTLQATLFASSMRWWRSLGSDVFTTPYELPGRATAAANEATATKAKVAPREVDTPQEVSGSPEQTQSVALEALTVEQLDRVASANDVEDYPQSGSKRDKLDALTSAGLSLEALTVEQLDRVAAANEVDDYPQSGTKSEKVAALEAAGTSLA